MSSPSSPFTLLLTLFKSVSLLSYIFSHPALYLIAFRCRAFSLVASFRCAFFRMNYLPPFFIFDIHYHSCLSLLYILLISFLFPCGRFIIFFIFLCKKLYFL